MDPRPFVVLAGIAATAWMQGRPARTTRGAAGTTSGTRRTRGWSGSPRARTAPGGRPDLAPDVPDMSREFADVELKARWIETALDAVTDLEPSFWSAYENGISYLTILRRGSPGAVDRAIRLLEKGIRLKPEEASTAASRDGPLHRPEGPGEDDRGTPRRGAPPGFDSSSRRC